MANKLSKLILSGAAILASATALSACDDIEATPEWNADDVILANEDGLTNNEMKVIYEALIKSGSSNSEKVLTELLKRLSISYFGDFYGDNGLYEACKAGNETKLTAFANSHKLFKDSIDKDASGKTLTDDNAEARVKMYCEYVIKQIKKEFVSIVKNSSYQERSYFKEVEWVRATRLNGYNVTEPNTPKTKLVNGNLTEETVDAYFNADFITLYKDYIEREILPNIYQKKLVEYFIAKVNPGALGRTYARKVSYIKVADNAEYPSAMNQLVKAYAEKVIETGDVNTYGFNFLSDLVKGTVYCDTAYDIAARDKADEIYAAAKLSTSIVANGSSAIKAPVETTLGGYIKSYNKITTDRFTNDTAAYDDFTSNGAYTKEVGLQIKVDSLIGQATTATNNQWFTSSNMSSIPSKLKERLFKVAVSNEIYASPTTFTPTYGKFVQGNYYLTDEMYEASNTRPYIVYTESATYIVKVEEAISVTKLQKANNETAAATVAREQMAYEAAHLISDNDTYVRNAKQYFVEKAALSFHDDYVYDYFADTFPDLFESND